MGLLPFYGKGPRQLFRAISRAARGQVKISGLPKRLNYCVVFVLHNLQMWLRAAQYKLAGSVLETHVLKNL